ncbi:hypothetical protein SAY86_018650 [Trapa natans]|uniref:Uncharacterized protein n=1 Tax=Trapa natans TaxID=22666 RepID=A0AAN7LRA2_TRANT|nr:hypothetical protein SAY86_018650 [Trapa natans]
MNGLSTTSLRNTNHLNSVSWAPHELGLCLACGSSDGNISVLTARADGGWDMLWIQQAHPYAVPSISWAPQTLRGALVGQVPLEPVQYLCSDGGDIFVKVWKWTAFQRQPGMLLGHRTRASPSPVSSVPHTMGRSSYGL